MTLAQKKILLGITGSIASVKCLDLINKLRAQHVEIKVVLTKSAEQFIHLDALKEALGSDEVYHAVDLFNHTNQMLHIDLARFADLVIVAPSTAHFIAKLSHGFADDLLSSVCLACDCTIAIAPAMNKNMWANQFTVDNIYKLISRDIEIFEPAEGQQACGDYGYGRMQEPADIIQNIERIFHISNLFYGKKIVITAGPTVEKIDPVRYISNFSSGKMGYALAKIARKYGAEVVLISGPVSLSHPQKVQLEKVLSADEMFCKVMEHLPGADIFISCAAVADYAPVATHHSKIKKSNDKMHLDLKANVDIVQHVASLNTKTYVVGFAAETDNLLYYAKEKLLNKNLDMVIANDVSCNKVFGSDLNKVCIITKDSPEVVIVPENTKENIAAVILQHIAENLINKLSDF
jgi:phosphopantothenoylcysteine decarboxylase/phosphopantothenate--cysteine ligase